MASPFVFLQEATNDNFVGRSEELLWLTSNLRNKEHTALVAPIGYGKKSLVRKALAQAQKQTDFKICTCDLFNIHNEHAFCSHLVSELFKTACTTHDDWILLAEQLLPLTQPKVEVDKRTNRIQIIFDKQRLQEHTGEVLQLAERIAIQQSKMLVICINEFQQIIDFENSETFQKRLLTYWKQQTMVTYLLCGSKVNAMHNLFSEKQIFYKFCELINLEPIEQKAFSDYIVTSFTRGGRGISEKLADSICQQTACYPRYTQWLAHLCWRATIGYVNEKIVNAAMNNLLALNERLFRAWVDSFPVSQINYLRAVIDNVDRFSSAESLKAYQFHSSANIMRIREALEKKEILRFIRRKPIFIDPVFEYWLRKKYFTE